MLDLESADENIKKKDREISRKKVLKIVDNVLKGEINQEDAWKEIKKEIERYGDKEGGRNSSHL